MRYWYRDHDWWYIGFSYDPALVTSVKKFAGAGYNPQNREWYIPFSLVTVNPLKKWLEENGFKEGMNYVPSRRVIDYEEPEEVITAEEVEQACKEIGMKRIPRPYQCEGVAYMINHGNCINGDDCGLGKAQPLDTKILTPDGYILMGDIKIGDEILSPSGGTQTVIGVFPQRRKLMYKVTFSDGSSTRCCEEHLWSVSTDNWIKRGKGFKTLSLKEIMNEDIYLSFCQKSYRWRIPMTSIIQYSKRNVSISPYLLGCLLGDGGISSGVGFTTIDDEIIEYLILPKGTMIYKRPSDDITYHIGNIDNVLENKNSRSIMKFLLKQYGLLGTHSHDKFIPKDYLYNTPEIRLEILRGLMDTDGYVSKGGHINYSSTSEQLKEDVKQLVLSFGGICRERVRIGKYKRNGKIIECKRSWRLSIMLPPEIIPFKLKRKIDRLNFSRKYIPTRKIIEIKPVGFAEMQCIRVSNEDGLYLCDDFCVTHNTAQTIILIELLAAFPALIVTPASVKYNWKKEWAKWMPDRKVGVIERKRKFDPAVWNNDVVVINYDVLGERNMEKPTAKFKELLKKYWGACALDEIHFLKSEKALRTKMAKKITKRIEHVWGLTGTLTQNKPADLIQPFKIIRRFDDIFGDTLEFKFRYCNGKQTTYGFDDSGFSNLEELHELLRMGGYIRRNKRDVLEELPPLVEQTVDVPIVNLKEYRRAESDLLAYLEKIDIEKANNAVNAPHLVMINTLKSLSVKGKLPFMQSYIKDWLEANEDEQLVVFGVHREPLQELAKYFKAPIIQGGVSADKKQQIVNEFSQRKHRLLFANIQSAGTGTDGLQDNCSNLFYIELPDKSTDLEQTNSRLERMGQKNSINITYLLSPDTIDVEMRETVKDKSLITGVVNRGQSENELLARKFLQKHLK
jgi:superfamily II DNA or RNA helicase